MQLSICSSLIPGASPGAHASAGVYSLVDTCKANGIAPYQGFTRLPLAATANDYAPLMPCSMPAAPTTTEGALKDTYV